MADLSHRQPCPLAGPLTACTADLELPTDARPIRVDRAAAGLAHLTLEPDTDGRPALLAARARPQVRRTEFLHDGEPQALHPLGLIPRQVGVGRPLEEARLDAARATQLTVVARAVPHRFFLSEFGGKPRPHPGTEAGPGSSF